MERLDYFGLEYRHVGQYLKNEISKDKMIENLTTLIRKFAKVVFPAPFGPITAIASPSLTSRLTEKSA